MKHTLKSALTIGMLVAALAMTGGCGDNDNSDNSNGNDNTGPTPPRRTSTPVVGLTATPVPTSTPVVGDPTATATPAPQATVQNVSFNFTVANPAQGFQIKVTYPKANGSFTGTGENVGCTTAASGIFTKNDNDAAGTLTLSVAATANLTFPIDIACTFDATTPITSANLAVEIQEVTQNNTAGNKADLTVTPSVS